MIIYYKITNFFSIRYIAKINFPVIKTNMIYIKSLRKYKCQ